MIARDINSKLQRFDELSRYDIVLASIPLAFLAMIGASWLFNIPPEVAMLSASLLGILAMLDGMVLRPPNSHGGL